MTAEEYFAKGAAKLFHSSVILCFNTRNHIKFGRFIVNLHLLNPMKRIIAGLWSVLTFIPIHIAFSQSLTYPVTRKVDQTDVYHGITVADPYRWLEDDQSDETKKWVDAENSVTAQYLASIPFRDSLKEKMKANWNFIRYELPFRCGKSYFYYRHDGRQNQPVLYFMKSLEFVPFSYFDPNKISADGSTAISATVPSPDGNYLAFQVSGAGSDWNEIRVKEVKSMKSLPEILTGVKFSQIAWFKDGFFYSRYTSSGSMNARNEFHRVYYHRLNSPQDQDSLVWEDKEHPLRNFTASVTEDQRYLIITGSESTSGNSVFVQDLRRPGAKPVALVKSFEHDFDLLGSVGNSLFFLTNYQAPRKKIIIIDPARPAEAEWKDIVPEQTDILQSGLMAWDKLMLHYMKDASSRLMVFSRKGVREREIQLDGFGTIEGLSGSQSDSMAFFSFVSFTQPSTVYKINLKSNKMGPQFQSPLPFDPADYVTEQVFYSGKDGTKIPMFLVHRKGMVPTASTPTLLFGYGGFNISKTPEFKPERLLFLEKGGLFVMANIRGGGEYGTTWHKAGTKLQKQNVFDDFIAAAEFLIDKGYTSSDKLAISGRSNGGLLVGAVMTQRPDLFKVALPAVGVMDMLRFHRFTIGWAWTSDYGSSDNKEEFEALYQYSPYHRLKPSTRYPATLITTADHDDRVVPGHSFKFAARLQECQGGEAPVLIRVDKNAGHGSGKATSKLIDEQSDIFAFLFHQLGMTL